MEPGSISNSGPVNLSAMGWNVLQWHKLKLLNELFDTWADIRRSERPCICAMANGAENLRPYTCGKGEPAPLKEIHRMLRCNASLHQLT